jgi:isopentenyldiphosphate isomerase
MADELVEEVDEQGNVLRVVTRAVMRADRLRHRCVYLFVLHEGRLLVHRRAPHKDVWPSRWDVAAGGVAAVGEPWRRAAQRELAEELGITGELVEVGGGAWQDDEVKVLGRVYVVEHPGPFAFDDGEVIDARFVDACELDALLASESTCPDSVGLALPLVRSRLA